jgi:hypothetical protein
MPLVNTRSFSLSFLHWKISLPLALLRDKFLAHFALQNDVCTFDPSSPSAGESPASHSSRRCPRHPLPPRHRHRLVIWNPQVTSPCPPSPPSSRTVRCRSAAAAQVSLRPYPRRLRVRVQIRPSDLDPAALFKSLIEPVCTNLGRSDLIRFDDP